MLARNIHLDIYISGGTMSCLLFIWFYVVICYIKYVFRKISNFHRKDDLQTKNLANACTEQKNYDFRYYYTFSLIKRVRLSSAVLLCLFRCIYTQKNIDSYVLCSIFIPKTAAVFVHRRQLKTHQRNHGRITAWLI